MCLHRPGLTDLPFININIILYSGYFLYRQKHLQWRPPWLLAPNKMLHVWKQWRECTCTASWIDALTKPCQETCHKMARLSVMPGSIVTCVRYLSHHKTPVYLSSVFIQSATYHPMLPSTAQIP